jgi:hypothetical protein
MDARQWPLRILGFLCVLAGCLGLWVSVASATITHEYLSQITEVPAVGPHGEAVPIPGPLRGVNSLSVDGGNVWLAEQSKENTGGGEVEEFRIDEFSASSGGFVSQLPQVPGVSELKLGVAVGHAGGEAHVYVPGYEPSSKASFVLVFGASGDLQDKWTGAATKAPGKVFGCLACNSSQSLVAVDSSSSLGDWATGDVYVADPENHVVDVLEPEGASEGKLAGELTGASPTEPFSKVEGVAVSGFNGDVFVTNGEVVDMFKPAAITGQYEFVGLLPVPPTGTPLGISDVAIDGVDGDIYVGEVLDTKSKEENAIVSEFSSTGAYLGHITGAGTPGGPFLRVESLAVDSSSHHVFVGTAGETNLGVSTDAVDIFSPNVVIPDVTTGPVSGLLPESVTFNGTVNPEKAGVATCQFDYGTSPSFGQVAPCLASVAEGESPVAVQATQTALQPDTTYHYRLQATNVNGTNLGESSQNGEFTTQGPGIGQESVSNVTSSSTTLEAAINPHEKPTTYYFQLGTSTSYGRDIPGASGVAIGAGEGSVQVSQLVQEGLSAATTYHYRAVAVSEVEAGRVETFTGPDETFTTQAAGGGLILPDGRDWEMVTPPEKRGAQLYGIGQYSGEGAVMQAASGGGALTWIADDPSEAEPHGYADLLQGFSVRGPGGWVSRDIGIPHPGAAGISIGYGQEYRFFSEDLSHGIVQPFGKFVASLSAEASEQTAYLSTQYQNGAPIESCSASCFRPLVTGTPGFANVPEGTVFGEESEGRCRSAEGKLLCGPHFVGATPDLSHVVLQSETALTSAPAQKASLYEWSAGKLTPISTVASALGSGVGASGGDQQHAISDDGSRVFMTEIKNGASNLVMRDLADEETLEIAEKGIFEDASANGSMVFFSGQMCEVKQNAVTGKLECPVTKLGRKIVGASEDGSWVYFVGSEVLAQGGVLGGNNLYVHHDGLTRFIANVSAEDAERMSIGSSLPNLTSRVSPDGHWLAFMSEGELTGTSTRDALDGLPDEEVYLYDAEANGGAGRLVCASCSPSNSRPVGVKYLGDDTLWSGDRIYHNPATQIASNIPGWTPYISSDALYQSRYLSDSGRLFFNSDDGLIPQDVNGTWDVYEYEPPGIGDCSTSKVTFSAPSNGCVGLISSGGSNEESGFLDASENGGDVFFLTSAKLASQDRDTALDIYDAHECTSGAPCFAVPPVEPPACDTGDACKPAPTPQPSIFGSPSSATFTGAGNVVSSPGKPAVAPKGLSRAQKLARALKACRKKKGKRRAACVRQAKARYAVKKVSGANSSKRSRG